ncbi:MAG: TolC family protein [Candidatus Hydrogenedentes bacterium]|nr:TolC family protein [Candidatus Hydrogenedentota bacterium]
MLICAALGALVGCATVEFSRRPEIPDIRVRPPGEIPAPSPPALPATVKPALKTETVPAQEEPLVLTVEAAIAMALENNQSLQVEQVNPALARTRIAEEKAVFDPTLVGAFTRSYDRLERDLAVSAPIGNSGNTVTVPVDTDTKTRVNSGNVGVTELLPTGTSLSVDFNASRTETRNSSSDPTLIRGNNTDVDASTIGVSITQQLLRGAGLGVNLASLRQARLAAMSSDFQLRAFVESLVAQVENTYWDYYLAAQQIKIFEDSLAVAETQAAEVEERIRVGKVAESERAAADAEVAQRRSSLIDARSNLAQVRLTFLRLLNPSAQALRAREVTLVSEPLMPDIPADEVESSFQLALRMRPELNQSRMLVRQDELEVVKTKNGLLPQLEFFLTVSKELTETEYAASFQGGTRDLEDDAYRTDIGAQLSYPLGNRAAHARHFRAELTHQRDLEAVANLEQLVEQDVRGAYIELQRAREQVSATAATRKLQELTAQTELEKFRVGRSTTVLVAQTQRDLLTAQINEVQAATNFLKAIVNLYRLDGSLLLRRGVECPGSTPISDLSSQT